jgi:autoinducer 2 (AI-2) kinase
VFGVPFKQPEIPEASALGAALLAGLGTGVWDDAEDAAEGFVKIRKFIEPDMKKHRQYQELSEKYRKIYKGVRSSWS